MIVGLRALYRLLDVIGHCTCVLAIAKKPCEMPSFFSYAAEVLTDLLISETKISKKKTQTPRQKNDLKREYFSDASLRKVIHKIFHVYLGSFVSLCGNILE